MLVSSVSLGLNARMDWLWYNNHFLGVDWHAWKIVGWCGNAAFFSRFLVQWFASERKKKVVVPTAFWWLSLLGALLLLTYAAFYQHDSVFIFAYAFTWIPYTRNLVIHYREKGKQENCPVCKTDLVSGAKYCHHCGSATDFSVPKQSPNSGS